MCDRCRWNDHDSCQGWLKQSQRLRCLCRTCLDQRLARPAAEPIEIRTTDVTERGTRPGRPRLVLLPGGADAAPTAT